MPRRPHIHILHLTPPAFHALAAGDAAAAAALIPVPMSAYLLGPECHSVWQMRAEQTGADPRAAAWVTGIVWDETIGRAVGAAGFHGPPDGSGMVEVGYRIDPGYRRQGYARAALESLLSRAARSPRITRVRVTISPDNTPSQALASQYGFQEIGEQWDEEDGLEIIYERPAADVPVMRSCRPVPVA